MAEKVLVASLRQPGKVVKLDTRLAAHLVKRGTHEYLADTYLTQAVEPEDDVVPPRARKRTYRRRDLSAED